MAINTDFYGSNYYTLPNYYNGIKTANFTGATTPDITASALQYAINSGRYTAGTLVDSSASTHGIPGTLNGHPYNTMYDYGAVNCRLTNADCVRDRQIVSSLPIMWRCRYRNSGNANTDIMYNLYDFNVLNAPGRDGTWDLYRYNAIVSADFKKFAMCIVVIAFDGTITDNGDGTYTGSVTRYQNMDLNCYLSPTLRYDNSTKTAREYYPYISQIYLVPASGSSFDNFDSIINIDQSLGCIPNTLYNFACSKVVNNTPTDDNTPNAVITNAVSYMDGVPNSGGSIRYIYYAGDTEMTNTISLSSGVYSHFCIFGMIGGNGTSSGVVTWTPSGDNLQGYLHGVRGFTHCRIVRFDSSGGVYRGFSYWHDMPQTAEEIKDAILKMCSYMGCMISTSVDSMLNDFERSPRYIGVLDDNGIATGNYEEITAETLADFVQTATDDFIDNTPYDPAASSDPNTYSDETELRPMPLKTANIFNKLYLCNWDMYQLATYLYGIVAPSAASADEMRQKFLNANPIDCIVSLFFFPFELQPYFNGELQQIKLGNQLAYYELQGGTRMPITGFTQTGSDEMQIILDLGSCVYFPTFGDFRDYEPYSSADLVIPYHGTLSINPAEYMGHQIGVKCIVDLATGASIAYIFRDGLAVDSIPGTIGVQIPVSGIATADYNNAAFAAAAQLNAAKITQTAGFMSDSIGIVSAAMSANPLGVAAATSKFVTDSAASANAVDVAQYNVNHVKIPYRQTGTATPATSTAADQTARLIVRRPKMLPYDPEQFAHLNGYSCLRFGNLSEFSGYTVCSDVHISGNATAEEKNMIKSLLQSGVIL